jgi:hypothetical protein
MWRIAPATNLDSRSFWQSDDSKHPVNFGFDPAAQNGHSLSYIGQGEEQMGIDWTMFHECRIDVSDNATIDSQPGPVQNMELKYHVLKVYVFNRSRRFNLDQIPTVIFIRCQNVNSYGAVIVNKGGFKYRSSPLDCFGGFRNSLLKAVGADLNTVRKHVSGQSADLLAFFKDRQRLLVWCGKQMFCTEPKQPGTLYAMEITAFCQVSRRIAHGS